MSIAGVTLGDPFSSRTFSGSAAGLLRALQALDPAVTAVSALPSKASQAYYKALSFRRDRETWIRTYRLRPDLYALNSRIAKAQLQRLAPERYDTVLQIAAFYNLAKLPGRVTVSFHDATLATLLQSPFAPPRDRTIAASLVYEHRLYHDLDHLFTMSAWAKDGLVRDFGVDADKITVAGAGVNLRRLAPIAEKSYAAPAILFVGKEFTRKGGDVLLRAFTRAREAVPEATLTIVGPAALDAVPAGVTFLGQLDTDSDAGLDRLLHEYARATIFAMPSLYEPFGIVFLEAMAHALPLLVSDQCAMPEIVQHGKTGLVTPVGESDVLAVSLERLLRDPNLRARMGQDGRARYEAAYGWDRAARTVADVTAGLKRGRRIAG